MYRIPETFRQPNQDYITLVPLRRFASLYKIKIPSSISRREEYIKRIEAFADASEENREIVDDWLDMTLIEGIKDVYVKDIELSPIIEQNLNTSDKIKECTKSYMKEVIIHHIVGNIYDKDYKLVRCDFLNEHRGRVIRCLFCKMVYDATDESKISGEYYPAVVEIYLDYKIVLARVKPKANIYPFKADLDTKKDDKVSQDNDVSDLIRKVLDMFGISSVDVRVTKEKSRKMLFQLVDKYTTTPEIIVKKLAEKRDAIFSISNTVLTDICNISEIYRESIVSDMTNMVEKYLSISQNNYKIFTKGKNGYPIKMSATDNDASKVKEAAAVDKPLQTRAIFFDNKRILQNSQSCDDVVFKFKHVNDQDEFKVSFMINKFALIMKFVEYTEEADIENVLFDFIGAGESN